MYRKRVIAILLVGLLSLTSAQIIVSAHHTNLHQHPLQPWITSKYRDGIDTPGHEVPANTVPIPIDSEMGNGPCDFSMTLFSDTNTWHIQDGVAATIHNAPAGQNWMTPFGSSNWVWGSSQTAAGEYTFVRPVLLPTGAYNIEARIQFGVNDFYKLFIQHGDGAGVVSQHLDTDYSHSNSQQGQPTDLWTDDLVDGLNYFIFEANNSDALTPDNNSVPGTPEGGLMFQIDIIYCREFEFETPIRTCEPDNPQYVEDIYVSNQNETMHRAGGTNDPWALTPLSSSPQYQPGLPAGPLGPTSAEYVWPQNNVTSTVTVDEMGSWEFKHSFQIPPGAKYVTADFIGITDNRFMPFLPGTITMNPFDSIIIASGGNPTQWAIQADSLDDIISATTGPTINALPDNTGPTANDYDLMISSRNRLSSQGNPTPGMVQYELVVKYCWDPPPPPPPCEEGDIFHEVQYVSNLSVQYIDPAAGIGGPAPWNPVYAPSQNGAWANPIAPSQWIWAGGDADGDGSVDVIGQGTFMFRQDFTVPSNAYKFNFHFNGMADNTIVEDPVWGQGSSTDVSIRTQDTLTTPFSSGLIAPLYLLPAPSDMNATVIDHYNSAPPAIQIPPEASALSTVNTDPAWDFIPAPGQLGETDLSLVVFARNRQSSSGVDTDGGLAYTLNVSYCVSEGDIVTPPIDDGNISDPDLPGDPVDPPIDDDDDDECECLNSTGDSEADGLPGFTTPIMLCGLMLAAIIVNRRKEKIFDPLDAENSSL